MEHESSLCIWQVPVWDSFRKRFFKGLERPRLSQEGVGAALCACLRPQTCPSRPVLPCQVPGFPGVRPDVRDMRGHRGGPSGSAGGAGAPRRPAAQADSEGPPAPAQGGRSRAVARGGPVQSGGRSPGGAALSSPPAAVPTDLLGAGRQLGSLPSHRPGRPSALRSHVTHACYGRVRARVLH